MGLSRNKVAVPEGAAGTPPFWSVGSWEAIQATSEVRNLRPLGFLYYIHLFNGGLAQLARALAWHARGHRFDPDILHLNK